MSAWIEWMNYYGPVSWGFFVLAVILGCALLSLAHASLRLWLVKHRCSGDMDR